MLGTLFVVSTPIGNLEDLTFRALRTLREVDLIAAEDTRRTAKLLTHYGVQKPMVSLHEHNEYRETPGLIAKLTDGKNIAVVSDAGTPGLADPGSRLVRAAHAAGVQVVPIPGPSAIVAALSASGLGEDGFMFWGFAPSHGGARSDWFDRLETAQETVVFFEAPHRSIDTISRILAFSVKRPLAICRELSKIHEQLVISPSMDTDISGITPKGEFTIILGKPANSGTDKPSAESAEQEIVQLFSHMTKYGDISDIKAADVLGSHFRMPAKAVLKAVKKAKISGKRQNSPPS